MKEKLIIAQEQDMHEHLLLSSENNMERLEQCEFVAKAAHEEAKKILGSPESNTEIIVKGLEAPARNSNYATGEGVSGGTLLPTPLRPETLIFIDVDDRNYIRTRLNAVRGVAFHETYHAIRYEKIGRVDTLLTFVVDEGLCQAFNRDYADYMNPLYDYQYFDGDITKELNTVLEKANTPSNFKGSWHYQDTFPGGIHIPSATGLFLVDQALENTSGSDVVDFIELSAREITASAGYDVPESISL